MHHLSCRVQEDLEVVGYAAVGVETERVDVDRHRPERRCDADDEPGELTPVIRRLGTFSPDGHAEHSRGGEQDERRADRGRVLRDGRRNQSGRDDHDETCHGGRDRDECAPRPAEGKPDNAE